ncbi:hypothetical protein K438DRAFT_1847196 [Mycena galopus ATCC 62051]|nr:hypothetical protein K438DRAFT_1847196 [Mycena galopus ATCC 62051]
MVVGHLATTRAPFLEGNWQDTSYGFRRLQPLVPATAEFEIPDNRLNLLSDIFAVDAGHTKTVDYVRMWAASGIEATTHFVLVLWAQASPTIPSFPPSLLPSPLRLLSPAPSSSTSSSQRSHLSLSFSQLSQPISEFHSPIPEVPPADFGDALRPDTTFPMACQIIGIAPADIQRARRDKKSGLVPMVRNWEAAAHVVAKLCLSVDTQEHQFSGGLKVTLADVLAELGWVVLSFIWKSTWYLWAAEAATLNWPGSVPREGECDFELYMLWKAICFLWKLAGPIRTGNIPSKGSADPEERAAASLTQDILQKARTKLAPLLVKSISSV